MGGLGDPSREVLRRRLSLECPRNTAHDIIDGVHDLTHCANSSHNPICRALHPLNLLAHPFRGIVGLPNSFLYLVGYDGTLFAHFTCPSRFDGGIERQPHRLCSKLHEGFGYFADIRSVVLSSWTRWTTLLGPGYHTRAQAVLHQAL